MNVYKLSVIFLLSILTIILSVFPAIAGTTLLLPANNSDCADRNAVFFKWNKDNSATAGYALFVSIDADMKSSLFSKTISNGDTSITVSVPDLNTTYYWYIGSLVGGLTPPSWSSIFSFRTLKAPPTLTSPTNNYGCVMKSQLFQWQFILGVTYTLQISTSNQFTSYVFNQSGITTDTLTATLPAYSSTYYWRVNAAYSTCVTDYSVVYTCTTQEPPTTLSTPANKSGNMANDGIRFKWASLPGASTYTLQIATDSNFTSPSVFYEGIKNSNTDSVRNFNYNTQYFWRVSADKSGCPIPWTSFFSFLTKYSTPQNPSSKSDSCDPSIVKLQWDPVNGNVSYRVQISEKQDFNPVLTDNANISTNYTTYSIPKLNQRYYWRVKVEDAMNSGDWSAVNNFINNGGYPDRLLPVNNSSNQQDTLLFKWVKPDINSIERIQIADNNAFNPILFDLKNIADDSVFVIMPKYNKTYYWKILSDFSCTIVWSDIWQFTTTLMPPQLVFPANNADRQSQNITFQWLPGDGATSYEFSLSTDPLFQTQNIVKGVKGYSGVTYPVKNLSINTNYYWRVKASNSVAISAWSDIYKFRTGAAAPAIPNLTAPANGKQNLVVTKNILSWEPVLNAKYYWIQIDNKNDFSSLIKNIPDLTDTLYDLTGLNYNTTYYWRVLAISDSSQSDWSSIWSFSTAKQFPTDIATLTAPAKNSEVSSANISFNWEPVDRADYYDFQLSTDEKFPAGKFVAEDSTLIVNSKFVTGLQNYVQYFWRVRGKNTSGHASWSETWNFSTLISPVDDIPAGKYQINISPNPVTGLSTLSLNLPVSSNVKIEIINLLGIKTEEIVNNKLSQGDYSYIINSSKYKSGLYYLVFTIDGISITKKMIILK